MISYRFIKDGIVNKPFVLQGQNGLIKVLKRQIEVCKSNEKDLNQQLKFSKIMENH